MKIELQERELKQELREKIREQMDYARDYSDEEVEELIDEELLENRSVERLSVEQRRRLKKELFDSMRRLDILQLFVEDNSVTEIMINGMDHIFVEREGRIIPLEITFESKERLKDVIQQVVAGCKRERSHRRCAASGRGQGECGDGSHRSERSHSHHQTIPSKPHYHGKT